MGLPALRREGAAGQDAPLLPQLRRPAGPGKRYFPPEGKETAASAQYDGADKSCPACQTPNGAKSHNCRHCGSPLDGAQEVGRVADQSSAAPKAGAATAKAPGKKKWWPWALGGVAALCCVFSGVAMFWTKDVTVTVTAHEWKREIDVESMQAVSDDSWCDSKPSDAYNVSSRREQRSTKKIPDGEECSTRNVDRGDGTFERRRECHTKYREEPIYDNRCYYTVDRWKTRAHRAGRGAGHLARARLAARAPVAHRELAGRRARGHTARDVHAEPQGQRRQGVQLQGAFPKWQAVADGLSKTIKVGVITDAAECDTL